MFKKYMFDTNALIKLSKLELLHEVDFNQIFITNYARKEFIDDYKDRNNANIEVEELRYRISLMEKIKESNIVKVEDKKYIKSAERILGDVNKEKLFNLYKERGFNDIAILILLEGGYECDFVVTGDVDLSNELKEKLLIFEDWQLMIKRKTLKE